jgi:hypothetical protein
MPSESIFGACAGAFVGFILGIINNIVVYNISNQAIDISSANSMCGDTLMCGIWEVYPTNKFTTWKREGEIA